MAKTTPIYQCACVLHYLFVQKNWTISTAESCTAGLLAQSITNVPNSSKCFDAGIIAYSNQSKTTQLNISKKLIDEHGAVSTLIAEKMAQAIQNKTSSSVAVSTTGFCGPDDNKPTGLVIFGFAMQARMFSEKKTFTGSRNEIQSKAVHAALQTLIREISS